jgi:hypothetical protein
MNGAGGSGAGGTGVGGMGVGGMGVGGNGAGGMGVGGMGVGGMGEGGMGVGGMGEGGMGVGGMGGNVDPMSCEAACQRLANCAAGDDWCPDLGPEDADTVAAGCLTTCTPDLAAFITDQCDDFMMVVLSFSEEFAEACNQPPPDDLEPNCLEVYDATCDRYSECGVVVDDGMGGTISFADVCGPGRNAIEQGLIPCGGEMDDYTNDAAVDACVAAIRATDCEKICGNDPVGPPEECAGVLVAEAAVLMCE